ncbi:MAG: M23 family metallopeptidase [Geitlerinemataceae cyanobacterium]
MKRRIPEYYTLWLSRTGQNPWVLRFRPIWLTRAAIAVALAGAATASLIHHQRADIRARQVELNRQAQEVIEQIEALERELDLLRERSGDTDVTSSRQTDETGGRGGSISSDLPDLEADTLAKLANARQLSAYLQRQLSNDVRPAIEATLAYEEAIPNSMPIADSAEITSHFGKRPNPFGWGGTEFHRGIDFVDYYGAPILATAPGTVIEAGYYGGYGNQVTLQHEYGYQTVYAHLSEISVEVGDAVKRGDTVGELGNTGRSTGPHLHYEVRLEDKHLDPENFLKPPSPSAARPPEANRP